MTDTCSDTYADWYLLRRRASTMTSVTADWFAREASRLLRGWNDRGRPDSFAVLSVGSGDGELDLEILRRLFPESGPRPARLRYVALEPSPRHREQWTERIGQGVVPVSEATVLEGPFPLAAEESGERFDLVLMIHVLYYLEPRAEAVRQARARLAPGGCLVLVQQTETGIPELQALFLEALKGSAAEICSSLDLRRALDGAALAHEYSEAEAHLDLTGVLAGTEEGEKVLSFCLEADLRAAPPAVVAALRAELARRAHEAGGRHLLREPLGFFVLRGEPESPSPPGREEIEDYRMLVDALDWPALLSPRGGGHEARVLDAPCGRGRWLRTLQRSITPARPVVYDLLDLSDNSLRAACAQIASPFAVGQRMPCALEQVELGAGVYDLIHSIHGLYAVSAGALDMVLAGLLRALKHEGLGLIVLPARGSFYVRFWGEFLRHFCGSTDGGFTAAEDVIEGLRGLGAAVSLRWLRYHEHVAAADRGRLERYLKQEATANSYPDSYSSDDLTRLRDTPLDALLAHEALGAYLREQLVDGSYRFFQDVCLITFGAAPEAPGGEPPARAAAGPG